jgi:hypothetical protein
VFLNIARYTLILVLLLIVGCVKNDDFDAPAICTNQNLVANATYSEVKELFNGEPVQIQDDLIIEGFIASSDVSGNFFGTLHFQEAASNPKEGFQIDIDVRDYHLLYEVGEKIFIKLKGLYLGRSNETYKLGGLFTNAGGNLSVGRLPRNLVGQHIISDCKPAAQMVPVEISLDTLNHNLINMLVSIKNMQVSPVDVCKSFAVEANSTIRILEDCQDNQINLINSGYSDFQAEIMPTGSGTITGILGYNSGKFNLVVSDATDLEFSNPRCDGSTFICDAPTPNTTIATLKETYRGEPIEIESSLVIKGIITASDETGNFRKEIYLQDTTAGIKLNINSTNLFELGYERNREVIISCKELFLIEEEGELQLGKLSGDQLIALEEAELYRHIYLQDEYLEIEPFAVNLTDIKPEDTGKWVQLNAVQFTYPATTIVENNTNTRQPLNDCFGNLMHLSTHKAATFSDLILPDSNGSIQGILSQIDNTYVLRIRDENDLINLKEVRCDLLENSELISISDLKSIFEDGPVHITQNLKIKAMVISDSSHGNFKDTELVVQDAAAGIVVSFKDPHLLPLYSEVELLVWNGILRSENEILEIANLDVSHIINSSMGTAPQPISLSMEEINNSVYQSRYVSFNDVQFIIPGTFSENTKITDCENDVAVPVSSGASFFNQTLPQARGKIQGVLSNQTTPVLRIRNTDDFEPTGSSQICYLTDSNEVFISELADPNNNADARFVELYNAGAIDVLLDGWKLIRYTNDNTEISSEINLSGYRIRAGETFIISPNAIEFEQVYGFTPDLGVSSNSPADSNGDDILVLMNAQDEIIDIFGVIGEDGSGTNHEFEDGRAYRKAHITKGNSSYTFTEWEIFNDTGGSGTTNQPQNAPEDFTPGLR